MKIVANLCGVFCCLMATHAGTLRITIDSNWVQPYVVSGNSNEVVARVILDGSSLDRDVDVNDIPLTLTLSNLSFSTFTNCVLWGIPYALPIDDVGIIIVNPKSCPINAEDLKGTNIFRFSSSPRVFRGEQRTLYLTCGISRGITNGHFRWGLGNEYISSGLCTFSNQMIVCNYYTNQIYNFQDGSLTDVEMIASTPAWIPIVTQGIARVSLTLGEMDSTGVRSGQIIGQGRPFRKYMILESPDLKVWYHHVRTFHLYVEADADGEFRSGFENFVRGQRAMFYRAHEILE